MTKNTSETIGCDLGDKRTEICVLHENGQKERHSIKTTREALQRFFTRTPAHVVIEVGAQSRWVAALLNELGHRATVANPRRVKLISASDSKMDQHDAELLARLGRADVSLLAPVQHRAPRPQTELAVAKARDLLVATRTRLINHVRGVLKAEGQRLPKCTAESFARKTRVAIPTALAPALGPLYETLHKLDEQIREHDRSIELIAKRYPDVDVLSQPPGVGVLTALVFILTLEDKERFASSRTAGAFIGLRPRKSQSGDRDPQLHITKAGDPLLRKLLVGSANYILGPFGKDSDLRRWGLALAKRGGKNAKKRATVAVARKVAVLMHRLWVTGEVYEPLGYRQRREQEPTGAAA
jgi:transposase